MGLARIHRKAGRGLAILAILLASVGVHVVHPAYHRHVPAEPHDCCHAAEGHEGKAGQAGPARVPAARPSTQAKESACPICALLAAFHAPGPEGGCPVVVIDAAPGRLAWPALPPLRASFWSPRGARGPPAVLLPVVSV